MAFCLSSGSFGEEAYSDMGFCQVAVILYIYLIYIYLFSVVET